MLAFRGSSAIGFTTGFEHIWNDQEFIAIIIVIRDAKHKILNKKIWYLINGKHI